MRIAQVAPLYESVPPKQYGGTERIVSYLTEEMIRQGHDVTLFASGDSETAARLIPVCHRSLRLDERSMDQLAHHVLLLEQVSQRAHEFDIIHFHIDYLHFPVSRLLQVPHVTTLHGRLDLPDLAPLYDHFRDMPVVSISNSLRDRSIAEWVGEISDRQKDEFLGNAYALLFPIDWPEPFGLVMIEAMACGTPVIAYEGGAVAEVIEEGRTGFVVTELEDAIEAVRRVPDLSRTRSRDI